jgi:hypothetical protein
MPQSDNDPTEAPANQQNQSVEKRATELEETQRINQDGRLREQSVQATETVDPDRSHEKRKRMEISL